MAKAKEKKFPEKVYVMQHEDNDGEPWYSLEVEVAKLGDEDGARVATYSLEDTFTLRVTKELY